MPPCNAHDLEMAKKFRKNKHVVVMLSEKKAQEYDAGLQEDIVAIA